MRGVPTTYDRDVDRNPPQGESGGPDYADGSGHGRARSGATGRHPASPTRQS
jgi:hypothetical protein